MTWERTPAKDFFVRRSIRCESVTLWWSSYDAAWCISDDAGLHDVAEADLPEALRVRGVPEPTAEDLAWVLREGEE